MRIKYPIKRKTDEEGDSNDYCSDSEREKDDNDGQGELMVSSKGWGLMVHPGLFIAIALYLWYTENGKNER